MTSAVQGAARGSVRGAGVGYVHGYSAAEAARLARQAAALGDILHAGTAYPAGARVLEAGCGVGAQTVRLLASSPGARFVCVDSSAESLQLARRRVEEWAQKEEWTQKGVGDGAGEGPGAGAGARGDVEWRHADVYELPHEDGAFDHVFVCFVLEHLADPVGALRELRRVLRPGGTLTVIEGDHGSVFFHPANAYAQAAIDAITRLQAADGGNALIGRELRPLLVRAGYADVTVAPRTVYADPSRPDLVEGFTRGTFNAVVASLGERTVAEGLMTQPDWDRALAALDATAAEDGMFHYTYCKAVAVRPDPDPDPER